MSKVISSESYRLGTYSHTGPIDLPGRPFWSVNIRYSFTPSDLIRKLSIRLKWQFTFKISHHMHEHQPPNYFILLTICFSSHQSINLWPPYEIGYAIIFLPVVSFFLFSSPNLSGCRLDVYHTYTHGVALVRI